MAFSLQLEPTHTLFFTSPNREAIFHCVIFRYRPRYKSIVIVVVVVADENDNNRFPLPVATHWVSCVISNNSSEIAYERTVCMCACASEYNYTYFDVTPGVHHCTRLTYFSREHAMGVGSITGRAMLGFPNGRAYWCCGGRDKTILLFI